MTTALHISSTGAIPRHFGLILLLAVAILPAGIAGLAQAETLVLKRGAGTSQVEGAIQEVNAGEVVYKSADGDRQTEPVESVLQIKAPKEPELTAAEQAYADGKWADAVTLYHRALSSSACDWARYRAAVRMMDAADKSRDFGTQVEAFIKLAALDPNNALAHQPRMKGVKKEELAAAVKNVHDGLAGADFETKLALLRCLAALHTANDEPKLAAEVQDEIKKEELAAPVDLADKPSRFPIGPHGQIFGDGGNARQIIFVCDGSGSMLQKTLPVLDHLQKAISNFKPSQSFNVILLQDKGCLAFDRTQLVAADRATKRKAYEFLDHLRFAGEADPIPGLTLAFQQHPQLIYFLIDGDFRDNKAIRDLIAKLNADHKVKINTIAYANSQDTDSDFIALLKQIARDNGGSYRHVAENELNQ